MKLVVLKKLYIKMRILGVMPLLRGLILKNLNMILKRILAQLNGMMVKIPKKKNQMVEDFLMI